MASGEMSRYHSWKNQLSAILFQVPVFFSLMLLHYYGVYLYVYFLKFADEHIFVQHD